MNTLRRLGAWPEPQGGEFRPLAVRVRGEPAPGKFKVIYLVRLRQENSRHR